MHKLYELGRSKIYIEGAYLIIDYEESYKISIKLMDILPFLISVWSGMAIPTHSIEAYVAYSNIGLSGWRYILLEQDNNFEIALVCCEEMLAAAFLTLEELEALKDCWERGDLKC